MLHRIFAALFLLCPLIIYSDFAYPYTFPRWIALATVCALWSITLSVDLIRKKGIPTFDPIAYAFLGLIAALGLATAVSSDIQNSLWGSMERSFGFTLWPLLFVAFLGIKSVLHNRAGRIFLVRIFIISFFIAALWGVMQKIFPGFSQTFSGVRVGGTLGNAIFFGMYLTLGIGIISYFIAAHETILPRTLWWYLAYATIACALIALWFAHARGAILGLVAGILITLSSWAILRAHNKVRAKIIAVVCIGLCLACGAYAYKTNIIDHTTVGTRLLNWNMAWHGFLDKPLLGWGPENYSRAADAHFESALSRASLEETHADKPHNYFLELAVSSGIIGLAAYIILISTILWTIFYLLKNKKFSPIEASFMYGLIGIHLIQNFSAFETHGSIILFIFILSELASKIEMPAQKKYTAYIILVPLSLVSIYIALYGAWRPFSDAPDFLRVLSTQGSYTAQHEAMNRLHDHLSQTPFQRDYVAAISFATVGQFWQRAGGADQLSAIEQTFLRTDIDRLTSDVHAFDIAHPTDGVWKLQLANSAFQTFALTHDPASGDLAQKLYEDVVHIAPNRQEPLMQLGQLSLLKNQPDRAIGFLSAAVAIDEKFALPHWQRGLVYMVKNNTAMAWTDINDALMLNFEIKSAKLAEYIYTQLLAANMDIEAKKFKDYFEAGT